MKTCETFGCDIPATGYIAPYVGTAAKAWHGHCDGHLRDQIDGAIEAREPFSVAPWQVIEGVASRRGVAAA